MLEQFRGWLADAAADPDVDRIVIEVDSPGGEVYGLEETALAVRSAAARKPVVAVANPVAASGAYWIASNAGEVVVTPSGEVGSIGVYRLHVDRSAGLARDGVSVTVVSAGERKTAGHPYAPLDALGREVMLAGVTDYHAQFVRAVARGRGVPIAAVTGGMGRGGMLRADAAKAERMADAVGTLDQVLAGRVGTGKLATVVTAPAASAEPSITPTANPLTRTAFHEAGHAVAAVRLGIPLVAVSVVPSAAGPGRVRTRPEGSPARAYAVLLFAGVEAARLLGRHPDDLAGARGDIRAACGLGLDRAVVIEAWERAERFADHHRTEIARVARCLLAERTLTGDQVRRLLNP